MNELHEFFAVTLGGGLYHVQNERPDGRTPSVVKIGAKGQTEPGMTLKNGLFLGDQTARTCLAEENLQTWDPRWKAETSETLKAIGPNHTTFIIDLTAMRRAQATAS